MLKSDLVIANEEVIMNLAELEVNFLKLKTLFKKAGRVPACRIAIILFAVLLWIMKLAHIDFFYNKNLWFIKQFQFDLVNNTVFTLLIWIVTIFAVLYFISSAYSLVKYSYYSLVKIPSDFKKLSSEEKWLLRQIYSTENELDCQHKKEVASSLKEKRMILLRYYNVGIFNVGFNDRPLYARANSEYKKTIAKLLSD